MTDNNHPITPPPELVQAFLRSNPSTPAEMTYEQFIATRFARWGANQELEACCEWLVKNFWLEPRGKSITNLRAARRPKPPSLRTALQRLVEEVLDANQYKPPGVLRAVEDARRALEALPE